MAVTSFQDFDLADPDREWDSDAAEKRVRRWAGAEDKPNEKYRDAHIWYDADNQDKFTAYKLPICDVVDEKLVAGRSRTRQCGRRTTPAPRSSPRRAPGRGTRVRDGT